MSDCPRAAYRGDGHDWANAPGERVCRKCGARETRGQMGQCWDGHAWESDGSTYQRCRRCGARRERDPSGASGW